MTPDFAGRLKTIRLHAELSVATMSVKSGVSVPQIHNLEAGGSIPTVTTVKKLAAALGVSTDVFRCDRRFYLLEGGTLGERIKSARLACGMTRKQLSQAIACHPGALHNLERGVSQGSWDLLCRIATVLGLSTDSLLAE